MRAELIYNSLAGGKGGRPRNIAMPFWVLRSQRLLETIYGRRPKRKELVEFCYETLLRIDDYKALENIDEMINDILKTRSKKSTKS